MAYIQGVCSQRSYEVFPDLNHCHPPVWLHSTFDLELLQCSWPVASQMGETIPNSGEGMTLTLNNQISSCNYVTVIHNNTILIWIDELNSYGGLTFCRVVMGTLTRWGHSCLYMARRASSAESALSCWIDKKIMDKIFEHTTDSMTPKLDRQPTWLRRTRSLICNSLWTRCGFTAEVGVGEKVQYLNTSCHYEPI